MDFIAGMEGKKGDLLRAALALFADRGYDAVSVRDIAKKAGVSEAALYKHFKGKEDMALFTFRGIMAHYTARLTAVHGLPVSAVEKLCRIVDITYELYRQYPAEIRFALLSQYNYWDVLENELKPHFVIKAIFEEGMGQGEIPRREVYFWITVYTGLVLQPLAQYPYFADVLPELPVLKEQVNGMVRKLIT